MPRALRRSHSFPTPGLSAVSDSREGFSVRNGWEGWKRAGCLPLVSGVPVGNLILLATDIESGDAPALCERFVA
jgi:hypothetical protein